MPAKLRARNQSKNTGLDSTGGIPHLPQHLNNKNQKQHSFEDEEDSKCDAILATRSGVGSLVAMKENAKEAPGKVLQEEELDVREVRDEVYVGYSRGLGLAGVNHEITSLKGKVGLLESSVKELMDQGNSLRDQVAVLTLASQEYRRVRHRFISTFKRDKLRNAMPFDFAIIEEGNTVAHGGDARVDALLYNCTEGRRDVTVFQMLYGIHPADVRNISK